MKKNIFLFALTLSVNTASFAQDIGGVVSSGNAMIEAARGIDRQINSPIETIELNSGQKINIYVGNKAYFVDSAGNQIPVPDGEYQARTGTMHTFRDSVMLK